MKPPIYSINLLVHLLTMMVEGCDFAWNFNVNYILMWLCLKFSLSFNLNTVFNGWAQSNKLSSKCQKHLWKVCEEHIPAGAVDIKCSWLFHNLILSFLCRFSSTFHDSNLLIACPFAYCTSQSKVCIAIKSDVSHASFFVSNTWNYFFFDFFFNQTVIISQRHEWNTDSKCSNGFWFQVGVWANLYKYLKYLKRFSCRKFTFHFLFL